MASFASSATTGGARKHAWTKRDGWFTLPCQSRKKQAGAELCQAQAKLSLSCAKLS